MATTVVREAWYSGNRDVILRAMPDETASTRLVAYALAGNHAGIHTELAALNIAGPDRRGIYWHPTHCEYHPDVDKTRVVYRPVPASDMEEMLGGRQGVEILERTMMKEFG